MSKLHAEQSRLGCQTSPEESRDGHVYYMHFACRGQSGHVSIVQGEVQSIPACQVRAQEDEVASHGATRSIAPAISSAARNISSKSVIMSVDSASNDLISCPKASSGVAVLIASRAASGVPPGGGGRVVPRRDGRVPAGRVASVFPWRDPFHRPSHFLGCQNYLV